MLKQIRYFQSVVRLGSFTAAAEEHFISQSAISQQIKALKDELGVPLLERKKRSFTLTTTGEFFYKKSLVLVADYDNIVRELQRVSGNNGELLKVGLLKGLQRQGVQQRRFGVYGIEFEDGVMAAPGIRIATINHAVLVIISLSMTEFTGWGLIVNKKRRFSKESPFCIIQI